MTTSTATIETFGPQTLAPTTPAASRPAVRPATGATALFASVARVGAAAGRWLRAGQLDGGSSAELARWSGARR